MACSTSLGVIGVGAESGSVKEGVSGVKGVVGVAGVEDMVKKSGEDGL